MDRSELLQAVAENTPLVPTLILPAIPGDRGIVVGANQDALSGLAQLLIETDEGLAAVLGDWRVIRELAEALEGQSVEVVERVSTAWGCHGIAPL